MSNKGFLGSLFDFSFTSFVTTRIIPVVYGLLIAAGVPVMPWIISLTLQDDVLLGFLCIIATPLVFLLYVVVARVYCEAIIVLFKIAENTSIMAGRQEQAEAPSAHDPAPPTV